MFDSPPSYMVFPGHIGWWYGGGQSCTPIVIPTFHCSDRHSTGGFATWPSSVCSAFQAIIADPTNLGGFYRQGDVFR